MDFGLCNISMEDIKINPSFRFLIIIDFFRFHKLPSTSQISQPHKPQPSADTAVAGDGLTREDIKSVMEKLGLFCREETEESLPLFGDVSELFDERPPCAAEVKEAFDVFDVNGDGFIDVDELQRVMGVLGLKEGEGIENCRKMIGKFDENGDGRIDFQEFVKLMESAAI